MTKVPLVISAPSTLPPTHLLEATPTDRPVLTLLTDEWEAQHLELAAKTFDRFVFLKESVRILDPNAFWAAIDATAEPAWLFARPSCYLAIYDSKALMRALGDRTRRSRFTDAKESSIRLESHLHELLPWESIWPDVSDSAAKRVEWINGAHELVIGNAIVEKFKGTARCPRCSHLRGRGVCPHYMALGATETGLGGSNTRSEYPNAIDIVSGPQIAQEVSA